MNHFFHFGLIVTGKGEEKYLPELFKSLARTGYCHFEVIRRIGQKRPITSEKRLKKIKVVGTNNTIPNKDMEEIGFPAINYLRQGENRYVILVDDLEYSGQSIVEDTFKRYRNPLDKIMAGMKYPKHRASVHFLANMVEAYFFADIDALNKELKPNPLLKKHDSDVEEIRHPKGELKKIYKQLNRKYNEIEDAGRIMAVLNLEKVLSDRYACAWLRSLFVWCVHVLNQNPIYEIPEPAPYCMSDGIHAILTGRQILHLMNNL